MSASPMARKTTTSQAIPIRKVLVNDPSELPDHYSSTPGGTLYSTTPGGTKIVYEKGFLLGLRNSPISRTPPSYHIPESMMKGSSPPNNKQQQKNNNNSSFKLPPRSSNGSNKSPSKSSNHNDQEEQFHLEI